MNTGTQPMRKVQWQDSIQTHSSDSESLHQTAESFIPLNCSPESPVSTNKRIILACLHSLVYSPAQSVNVDPLKSVLLPQNLPPLPKFSGELSDGGCGMHGYLPRLVRTI